MTWRPPSVDPHDEPTFTCVTCGDAGWEIAWCVGRGTARGWEKPRGYQRTVTRACGRQREHEAHTYAERCQCWVTNPVIQQRRAREAERIAKREKKGQSAA